MILFKLIFLFSQLNILGSELKVEFTSDCEMCFTLQRERVEFYYWLSHAKKGRGPAIKTNTHYNGREWLDWLVRSRAR